MAGNVFQFMRRWNLYGRIVKNRSRLLLRNCELLRSPRMQVRTGSPSVASIRFGESSLFRRQWQFDAEGAALSRFAGD